MKTKRLKPLRIYDWNETVAKNKTRGIKFKGYVPEDFSKEINNKNISVKIDGLWKEWELTDEGTGQYPIFKCTVKDGSLEIKNKNTHEKYSLKNAWIKVCTKIHYDNSDGIDTYSINRKALTLYSINNSFNLEGKNSIVVELLNSLLISWIKDNVECLNKFFRQYKVKTETKEDLSLLGWDTGYSTSFTNVNKVIEQQKTYPENFEETANSSYVKIYISGEFYPWKISTGADGQNVNFNCSIKPGGAIEISGYEFQFSDGNFVNIQVALKYLNVDNPTFEDPTSLNVGNQVDLMVKTEKGENNTDAVTITSSNYTGSTGAEEKMFIDAAFKAWFNENIDAFKQIFSSFLLNETSKNEDFQWLKPTTAYYGVASVETTDGKPDLDSSVFSVMSMVENNENSKPSHTVDSRILDAANNESAFAIKTPLFVQKWIIIGLEMMQVGTIDDFELISNGYGFKNKNKIQFATFENADGNNVPAYVEKDNFRLEIVNNQLKIEINDIVWEQSRRLNGHVNYSQYFDLELKSGIDELGEKYENVLIPVENTDPVLVITITQDEFDIWGDVVGDIIGGIVVGVVTGYLGSIVGKGIGTYLGKQLSKTSSGSWILKIDKAISDYLKNLFKGDKNAFNKISKDNIGLIEVYGMKESSKLIANTATNYASKIWANKSKFIGALIAGSVGFAIPKLIINAIDNYDKQHYSVLPNINDFVASTVGAVKWPDNSEFKLESAELSGVFLLGGKLERD